eukprot:3528524-Pleurochrysis_carterae.AAC.1
MALNMIMVTLAAVFYERLSHETGANALSFRVCNLLLAAHATRASWGSLHPASWSTMIYMGLRAIYYELHVVLEVVVSATASRACS